MLLFSSPFPSEVQKQEGAGVAGKNSSSQGCFGQAGGRRAREESAALALPQRPSPTSRWQLPFPRKRLHRAQAANIHGQLPAEAPATEDAPKTLASLRYRLTGHTTAVKLAPQQPIAQIPTWNFCPTMAHISHRPNGAAVALNHTDRFPRNQRG